MLNTIIGAGIFGLPARVQEQAGTYSVLAWLLCAVPIVLIVLCFAEVGSRFKETGGPYLYARVAFGSLIGFEVGWLMWLARLTAFAALCNLFVEYLGYFIPALSVGLGRAFVIMTVVCSLTLANIVGVRSTATVTNVFTVGKLIPLLLFVAVGLFFISPQNYLACGATDLYILHDGDAADGVRVQWLRGRGCADRRSSRPGAAPPICTSDGDCGCRGHLRVDTGRVHRHVAGTRRSERPLSDASLFFLGGAGASIMAAGALVSVAGTMNGVVLVSSRVLFAMAEQRQLPGFLAAIHRRFHTPHVAILMSALFMLGLTLFSTFVSAVTVSALIRLLTYVAICAALPVLRWNVVTCVQRRRLSCPGGCLSRAPGLHSACGCCRTAHGTMPGSWGSRPRSACLFM